MINKSYPIEHWGKFKLDFELDEALVHIVRVRFGDIGHLLESDDLIKIDGIFEELLELSKKYSTRYDFETKRVETTDEST